MDLFIFFIFVFFPSLFYFIESARNWMQMLGCKLRFGSGDKRSGRVFAVFVKGSHLLSFEVALWNLKSFAKCWWRLCVRFFFILFRAIQLLFSKMSINCLTLTLCLYLKLFERIMSGKYFYMRMYSLNHTFGDIMIKCN